MMLLRPPVLDVTRAPTRSTGRDALTVSALLASRRPGCRVRAGRPPDQRSDLDATSGDKAPQNCQRVPDQPCAGQQRRRLREHPGRTIGEVFPAIPPVPVGRQPPDVRGEQQTRTASATKDPADLLTGALGRGECRRDSPPITTTSSAAYSYPRPPGFPG